MRDYSARVVVVSTKEKTRYALVGPFNYLLHFLLYLQWPQVHD